MIKFLYLAAAILAFVAAFSKPEQNLLWIILGCVNAVLFKLQCIEEDLL